MTSQRSRAVAGTYQRLIRIGCTDCGYCRPCPFGVNIPKCFELYNDYHMGKRRLQNRVWYGMEVMGVWGGTPADASLCKNCGKCLKACPQHILIPKELKKVSQTLGGFRTTLVLTPLRLASRAARIVRTIQLGK